MAGGGGGGGAQNKKMRIFQTVKMYKNHRFSNIREDQLAFTLKKKMESYYIQIAENQIQRKISLTIME